MEDVDFERPPIVSFAALTFYLALIVAAAFVSFGRRDIAAAS